MLGGGRASTFSLFVGSSEKKKTHGWSAFADHDGLFLGLKLSEIFTMRFHGAPGLISKRRKSAELTILARNLHPANENCEGETTFAKKPEGVPNVR